MKLRPPLPQVLAGVRVTKLNGWEPRWAARLRGVRAREVRLVRAEMMVFGCTIIVMVTSPVVASLALFTTRMLSQPRGARLEAPDAFAALALIGALRFPINQLGELLGKAAQAYKAAQRVALHAHDLTLREGEERGDAVARGDLVAIRRVRRGQGGKAAHGDALDVD